MIHIRPVSDLRNKFSEIEKIVASGEPMFLTKNGYGNMVVMSIEQYSALENFKGYVDAKLSEAGEQAKKAEWLAEEEVFDDNAPDQQI